MLDSIKTRLSYISVLPKIADEGFLSFAEELRHIPFTIKRIYFIYDVDTNVIRGKHAHKKTKQMLFCLRGKITLVLDNGYEKETLTITEPNYGVLLDTMVWHEMVDFTPDTVLLVLASDYYDEADYIRDYETFRKRSHTIQRKSNAISELTDGAGHAEKRARKFDQYARMLTFPLRLLPALRRT